MESSAPTADGSPPSEDRRVTAAQNALRALIRDLYGSRFGSASPVPPQIRLSLTLEVSPASSWALEFRPPLTDQIVDVLEETEAQPGAFQPGHVYCFRCRSSGCEHSVPPGPTFVFQHYSPTGIPTWCELVQILLDEHDPRAEDLFAVPPRVVTRVLTGHQLRKAQLTTFGRASRTYAILGQVVAGYYSLPCSGLVAGPVSRFAITLQAVETRAADGAFALRLNVVPGIMHDVAWAEWLSRPDQSLVRRQLAATGRALETLERKARAARMASGSGAMRDVLQSIPSLLRTLARSLERSDRARLRRTRHALERSAERPIAKALQDAREAPPERLFVDEKRATWVVAGSSGRTHIFNEDGRHITSFFLAPGALEFRLRTNRWRSMTPDEATRFRHRMAAGESSRAVAQGAEAIVLPQPPPE